MSLELGPCHAVGLDGLEGIADVLSTEQWTVGITAENKGYHLSGGGVWERGTAAEIDFGTRLAETVARIEEAEEIEPENKTALLHFKRGRKVDAIMPRPSGGTGRR